MPDDLSSDYFAAVKMLGGLVCAVASRDWDHEFLVCALAALAVSKGFSLVAEAIQELDDTTAKSFLDQIRG